MHKFQACLVGCFVEVWSWYHGSNISGKGSHPSWYFLVTGSFVLGFCIDVHEGDSWAGFCCVKMLCWFIGYLVHDVWVNEEDVVFYVWSFKSLYPFPMFLLPILVRCFATNPWVSFYGSCLGCNLQIDIYVSCEKYSIVCNAVMMPFFKPVLVCFCD